MCGNIWKINFESALLSPWWKENLSFVYIFYCPIFVSSILSSPPSLLPIITKPVSVFFCLFFPPATLPTVCLRLYDAVTIYSRLIKYNDRTGWTDMNLSKLSAMKRSLLISTVSSWHSSHGQILCPHVFHYHSFLCFNPRVTVNLPVSLYTWWFLGFLPIHDKCRA